MFHRFWKRDPKADGRAVSRSKKRKRLGRARSRGQASAGWTASSLEPRLMLAADVAASAISAHNSVDPVQAAFVDSASHSMNLLPQSDHVVFIDANVEAIGTLADSIQADSEIILLDPTRNGIQQITEALAKRNGVRSIHLVGHGSAGKLQLGNEVIDSQTAGRYATQLSQWSDALTDDADIMIYGCETAQGSSGARLLASFAKWTGADIAASTNRTGHPSLGGDWVLERQIGQIESSIAFDRFVNQRFVSHLPITIDAAGVENTEQMKVLIGGQVAATFDNVDGDAYAGQFEEYTVNVDGVSVNDIRIAFTNDLFDESFGIDRNLRIDKINVDGVVYETEASSVYSTGTWTPQDGIVPGNRQSEYLHSNGYFDFGGAPSNSDAAITVFAQGSTGEESMELRIDGETVATWNNIAPIDSTYTFEADSNITPDRIQVAFTNDVFDPDTGEDRNLIVDKISIGSVEYETESPSVFSTGTWLPTDGIIPGFRESETLHANGYFQYGIVDPDPDPGTIVIRAAGTTGQEIINLQIDGQTVATFDSLGDGANTNGYREFTFQATGPIDPEQIRIEFTNDLYDEVAGIDRNVKLDQIQIDGQTFETEDSGVFSTGTWLSNDGLIPGFRESEWLHADGYFQFAPTQSTSGFIGLDATQFTVNEDDGSVEIRFIRYDGDDGDATVFFQTLGIEAEQGSDFLGTASGQVDFADGQSFATATISLVDDQVLESIETFSVSLFRAQGADLGEPRTAIVTIVDDESGRDLIANWLLDETSLSSLVVDSSENNNDGTFQNFIANELDSGPTSDAPNVESNNPGSVLFDGLDDYIQIAASNSLDLSAGTFTQSVWIKPTGTQTDYQGVLGFQSSGTENRYPGIWVYQQNRIHAGFGDGSNWNSFRTDEVLTTGQWNHVATTFDGTTYSAFVNGNLVFSTNDFAGRTPTDTNQVNIGRVDTHFEGGIDDVRIYNRALSAQEITVLIDGADLPSLPNNGQFVTNQLYSGFDTPLAVDWLPDGRMVVLEQAGLLQLINSDGTRQSEPLLDITDRVNAGTKDRGALGFAIHPEFENNPYVYVSYTYDPPEVYENTGLGGPDGNGARVSRISRFTVNESWPFADPLSEFVLVGSNSTYENIGDPNVRPGLNDPHSCMDENGDPMEDCIPADETSHTIGDLEFGIDGYLYASSGDGGSFGRVDPVNLRALDIDSLAGKVLRIDPITGEGPSTNPFYDGDANSNASKVYQYGLRNPFRLAVNPTTSGIYSGDVGWTQWEEINTGRGANFGWPAFEGGDGTSLEANGYNNLSAVQAYYATNPDVTAPIWARLHSDGARAIVMGDFISESVYPDQFDGDLLFTDIGDQILRVARFDANGSIVSVDAVSANVGFLVDIQMYGDGFLYYVDITGSVGRLEFQSA